MAITASVGKPGAGMSLKFRPSASQESGPRSVTAPRPVKARRGTRNRVQWQQIALHLEVAEVRS